MKDIMYWSSIDVNVCPLHTLASIFPLCTGILVANMKFRQMLMWVKHEMMSWEQLLQNSVYHQIPDSQNVKYYQHFNPSYYGNTGGVLWMIFGKHFCLGWCGYYQTMKGSFPIVLLFDLAQTVSLSAVQGYWAYDRLYWVMVLEHYLWPRAGPACMSNSAVVNS